MRLDKLLADMGNGTRSEVRALLRAGRVFVDGKPIRDGALSVDAHAAAIMLDGERVVYRSEMHLMMNKPQGVLTAARDARRETVLDLLPNEARRLQCMPVGRLDMDTEGLLLFTTDGELAHRLLSPRRCVEKEYIAQLDGPVGAEDVEAFAAGLVLHDFTAMPAKLYPEGDGHTARVVVHEGKYHQVKRMFLARGRTVLHLKRLSFAGIPLDASLPAGGYRELTADELHCLNQAAGR